MADEARQAMRLIPGYRARSRRWSGSGGLTNRVYRVRAGGETLVLRIPGEGTRGLYRPRGRGGERAGGGGGGGLARGPLRRPGARADADAARRGADDDAGALPRAGGGGAGGGGVPQAAPERGAVRLPLRALRDDRRTTSRCSASSNATLPEGYHAAVAEAAAVQGGARRASGGAGALPLRSAVRELPRYRGADVDRRLGVFRHERSALGPRRPLGRGGVRAGAGRGAARGLLRRAADRGGSAGGWSPTRRCATCSGRSGG